MKSLLHRYHLAIMSLPLVRYTTNLNHTHLITVHCHSLGVPAYLAISRRANWSATSVSSSCAALLKGQKLLGTEGLVVDLRSSLNQILEMGTGEEVSEVHEFAVSLILDVDNAPSVLAAADLLAADNDGLLRANDSEGNNVLTRYQHGFAKFA